MDLESYISSNVTWDTLPEKIRSHLHNDSREYEQHILTYSIQNQLRFGNSNLVHQIYRGEKKYYEKLIAHSRKNHVLYPYHLQDKIVPGLQITPFIYYRDMLVDMLRAELSYDSLPNFTAADCLRLFDIGRNQYIEIMNTYKSFLATAGPDRDDKLYEILYELLPQKPLEHMNFEPWHIVRSGAIYDEDMRNSTESEQQLIDMIIDAEHASALDAHPGLLISVVNVDTLKSLYCRSLVYIDVPVDGEDRICVPTLEGFVMNRVSGDNLEKLLYKIFVTADEQTTIEELAECLQVDSTLVCQAVSIFCRLGFAYKRPPCENPVRKSLDDIYPNSSPEMTKSISQNTPKALSHPNKTKQTRKLAFIFDSTITAYLMMGNLSLGLKPHAVTMYEVGKLSDDSLECFLNELDNLSNTDEGEVKVFYEHAINLREAIRFFRSQATSAATDFSAIDLIRGGSLLNLDPSARIRILNKNYSLIVSLSPLTYEDRLASNASLLAHIGPPIPEVNSPWFRLYVTYIVKQFGTQITAGLPAMLLCRGFQLTCLPECFEFHSRFIVTAWGHDPGTAGADSLLCTVNDMLHSSPVLIQALDLRSATDRQLYQRYIALPLSRTLLQPGVKLPAFLDQISSKLDLTSLCGYITVLAPCTQICSDIQRTLQEIGSTSPGQTENEATLSSTESVLHDEELLTLAECCQPIYLVTMNLGLPIFNADLLQAVCDRLKNEPTILNTSHRPKLEEANQNIIDQIKEFVYDKCGATWPVLSPCQSISSIEKSMPGPWPVPVRNILCHQGELLNID